MCGFAGEFVFCGRGGAAASLDVAVRMAAALSHRGPDSAGQFLSADGRCAIGFHRLAVIDPDGSEQPMSLPDDSATVAFNGEIYNFRSLRQSLAAGGARFATAGDTEVILHAYARTGPAAALPECLDGMFAFAVYDAARGRLMLARDRLGQKPLWYAMLADRIVFAGEPRAILRHPKVSALPDRDVVTHCLHSGYIHCGQSMFSGLAKLPAGSLLVVDGAGAEPQRYWRPSVDSVQHEITAEDAADQLRQRLQQSVADHLVADVPLGVLLSGGLDSAAVTAFACRAAGSGGGVKTFTAGFADSDYDERPTAAAVAKHLGTDHTELLIEPDAATALSTVLDLYDEPFGDSSALAMHLVCRAAREHVTVALTGDGGDEVFGGYDRYRAMHLADRMSPAAYTLARLARRVVGPFAPVSERSGLRRFVRFADGLLHPPPTQYMVYRSLFTPDELCRLLTDDFLDAHDADAPARWFCDLYEQDDDLPDELTCCQRHDLLTYLPDDLLVKSDIASMACGLELRAPMLDHRLVAWGLSLPAELKVSRRRGKVLLRAAMADALPAAVLQAPKRGFGLPLGAWLRGPLRDLMKETLLDGPLLTDDICRPSAIAGLINDHLDGRDDHTHRLWALMVLAGWLLRNQ